MKIIHVFRSGSAHAYMYSRMSKTWVRRPLSVLDKFDMELYIYTQKHPFLFKSKIQTITDFPKCFYYHVETEVWEAVYE